MKTTMSSFARPRRAPVACFGEEPGAETALRAAFALPLAAFALAFIPTIASASDRLYGFSDERGVLHFSDAPSDPRHRQVFGLPGPRGNAGPGSSPPRRAPATLVPLIHEASDAADVDPALVTAVAMVESNFDPAARSPQGALGLMQLMPATAARFGVANPLEPRQNLAGGARYLRELLDRFGTLPLALAAYNAGEGAVERFGRRIPAYAETAAYVPKVLAQYRLLRERDRADGADRGRVASTAALAPSAR